MSGLRESGHGWAIMRHVLALLLQVYLRCSALQIHFRQWGTSLRRWSSDEFEDGLAHGGQGWLRRRPVDSFFPAFCFEPAILKETVDDHRHERMTVKSVPGSALEVIE